MTRLLIHENAYQRIEKQVSDLEDSVDFIFLMPDGTFKLKDQTLKPEELQADITWLSVDMMIFNQMEQYIKLVLEAHSIKWLQTFHAGLDIPFYRKFYENGIRITKSDAQAVCIAEYVIANVLALYQGIFDRKEHQAEHKWQNTRFREFWKTSWLIVGFGNIGQAVAKRLQPFECDIIGVRRTPNDHPLADGIIALSKIYDYLPQADVVVLACALNHETSGLVNADFLAKMKPGSTIVNIARGKLIEQNDLIAALENGSPQYAVLDVFDPEPLPEDSRLWDMENVIISPHSSNAGSGLIPRGDQLFVNNLRHYLEGKELYDEIDADQL